ncbi:hypothetical protein OEG79_09165 [Pseudomonas sp. Z8(2022)]|uniref:hypothetical protein n=1 Tax=Pseudomonas sp. Z8(2022) TaxID=2962597 RepID=UPI0021F4D5F4|nr:hypothetical protein [Pseudomonas sp. Z8(2022)]UYP32236.1 hypothetical protein OEG79_09165 [Pseudomonas sp. Z8(2022)]
MNELEQALPALVPVDCSNIGNQSLLGRLKEQFPQLREEAFCAVRDGLIDQGVLYKGRGLGCPVLRAQPVASVTKGKAAKVQPASGIEDMKKILWATADKLRANISSYKMEILQHRVTACLK